MAHRCVVFDPDVAGQHVKPATQLLVILQAYHLSTSADAEFINPNAKNIPPFIFF